MLLAVNIAIRKAGLDPKGREFGAVQGGLSRKKEMKGPQEMDCKKGQGITFKPLVRRRVRNKRLNCQTNARSPRKCPASSTRSFVQSKFSLSERIYPPRSR